MDRCDLALLPCRRKNDSTTAHRQGLITSESLRNSLLSFESLFEGAFLASQAESRRVSMNRGDLTAADEVTFRTIDDCVESTSSWVKPVLSRRRN